MSIGGGSEAFLGPPGCDCLGHWARQRPLTANKLAHWSHRPAGQLTRQEPGQQTTLSSWAQEAGARTDSLVLPAADSSENCPQLRGSCSADLCPQDMGPEQVLHALFSQQNLSGKSVLRGPRP